jgi:hypothetical protein
MFEIKLQKQISFQSLQKRPGSPIISPIMDVKTARFAVKGHLTTPSSSFLKRPGDPKNQFFSS